MITLTREPAPPDCNLRASYLHGLSEPQELFLELQISGAYTLVITQDQKEAGYAVVDSEGVLLELFVEDDWLWRLPQILEQIINQENIHTVLCKSFDKQLLFACFSRPLKVKAGGFLFRKIVSPEFAGHSDISATPATLNDITSILAINDDFFEGAEEIASYIEDSEAQLLLFFDQRKQLVGCGISKRVIPGRPDFDIGMLVAPSQRHKGYGTYIVSYLKHQLLSEGLRPIAGCAKDNIGSLRTLQKAGFATEHRILEFSVKS